MPVTARLSKLFYERLGEQATNELVDWFNAVDATYKAELREFNELNFSRFDARVDQRFAVAKAEIDQRFAVADANFERRLADLEARIERRLAEFQAKFGEHTRFMYLAWASILAAVIGFGLRH